MSLGDFGPFGQFGQIGRIDWHPNLLGHPHPQTKYAEDLRAAAEKQLQLYQMQQLEKHFAPVKSARRTRLEARRAERRLARRIARYVR